MRPAFVALALLLVMPAASYGQVSVRGFADGGLTVFAAKESFEATLGQPSGPVYGGGIEFGERQFFLALGAQRFRRTGHRVFVFENRVFKLDVDDTITVTPIELTLGYRFRRAGRFIPYAGGGVGWHRFEESSEHSTSDEDVKKTYTGYQLLGGLEVPLQRWFGVGVDAQWARVPNAFGDSPTGVASAFDEHDLGGFTLRAKIIIGR